MIAEPSGGISIKEGEKIVASFTPKTAVSERGPATVREVDIASHAVLDVRIPIRRGNDEPGREEAWIAEKAASAAKLIDWRVVGAQDADGETSLVLKVAASGIEEYQTAARLSRCDGQPVTLFRRKWDFTGHVFRSAGPELPPPAARSIQGHRGGAPEGKPAGGFFFTAASSTLGAVGDAARLRPPSALNDGNPATAWTTDGDGRGQLVTARSSGGFPILGLRILPGDTSSEKGFRASARPRKLSLIFGRDPAQNLDVELVEDADGGARRFQDPFWVPLPKPVTSACVTVLAREVTSAKMPMSIAELDVLTEIDGPDAAERLVAGIAEGSPCQARQPLLLRLGAPALAQTSAAIVKAAPGPARECLIESLDALLAAGTAATPDTTNALVAALAGANESEDKILLKRLPMLAAASANSVDAIAAVLADDKRPDPDRVRAARVLAAMHRREASAHVIASLGHGGRSLRKDLRGIASSLKSPALTDVLTALETSKPEDNQRRADLLAVVGALAAGEPGQRAASLAVLRAELAAKRSFEAMARAILALGQIRDGAALDVLIDVREHDDDGVLRELAIVELANAEDARVVPALRAALRDGDPVVRETAASGLGSRHASDAAAELIAGAKQEPWPRVRRAEIATLGELCTNEGNQLLIRAFERDAEEVRQAALTGLAHCYGAKATGTLLRTLGRLAESADMRSLAARILGERKDPRLVPGLTEILNRLLTESQADLSLEGVIADTAMALAAIRTPEAISALVGLISDSRPSVQRIAVDSLGVVCDPGAGAAALRKAAASKDEAISIPAATAEARCREKK